MTSPFQTGAHHCFCLVASVMSVEALAPDMLANRLSQADHVFSHLVDHLIARSRAAQYPSIPLANARFRLLPPISLHGDRAGALRPPIRGSRRGSFGARR